MAKPVENPVALMTSAREALSAHERTCALAAAVPDPADPSPPRIALVGPYSAGKSLLVAALLGMSHEDAERISAATPHTTELMRYAWRRYELLDLPGTLSGLDDHEQVARQGVRSADALVIVTTVELPGEDEAAAIRQLLDRDGFRSRCVLVVNKAASENSDHEVIRRELERRVGNADGLVTVFTDARDFLDSVNEPGLTDEDRALLRSDSGIGDLEAAVEALFSQEVPPRRAAQLHEAARLLDDGLALWEPTVEEEVVEATAARAQAAIDGARKDAGEALDRALATLGDGIHAIGARLATAVDAKTGAVEHDDVERAAADESQLLKRFVTAVNDGVSDAIERLARDLEAAREKQEAYSRDLSAHRTHVPTDGVQPSKPDRIVEALRQRVSDAASDRLTRLVEQGTRPGSPMHDLARKVNRLLGKKPTPYAHIQTAETLSKGARASNFVLDIVGPIVDLGGVISDAMLSHRITQRRDEIRKRYRKHADALVAGESVRVRAHVNEQLAPYVEAASPQLEDAAEWRAARDAACARLTAARDLLAEAAGALA
jgi:hypothetical protein